MADMAPEGVIDLLDKLQDAVIMLRCIPTSQPCTWAMNCVLCTDTCTC